jgi:serine/threonine protein kinase/Flp pilus assembly protein TadD
MNPESTTRVPAASRRSAARSDAFPRVEADGATEQLALDLAREMRRRWHAGERLPAERFLSDHPALGSQPEAAVELIYEEYCLRQSAGDDGAEQDILRRFPQWAAPLRLMLDCHRRLLESDRDRPLFPAVGERVGDFDLLAKIARGAGGRVFLATQAALADRPVVLKVVPLHADAGHAAAAVGGEHLSLARLQHTNIVPLYSVTDDPARRVRALCMPYFGRATLASLHDSLAGVPMAARTGRHVVDAIDRAAGEPRAAGAARQMLAHVTYVQAMCWIAAGLADALHYAHERDLVHLDLKPSNVLLAGDGQPMLLDFHLARAPVRPGGPVPENFGGTPPYMPPEQQAALRALRDGRPVDVTVDGRADVYALGAMLYESLGGALPLAAGAPLLARVNPQVSMGLSDVVARCVAPDPDDRYGDAMSLADDLRRHLTDQPLAGVRNRSAAERWRKWRRRRPGVPRTAALLVLVTGVLGAMLARAWSDMRDRESRAELALVDGDRQVGGRQFAEAAQSFERGLALAERLPLERGLARQLRDQLASARRLQLADEMHRLADATRVLYRADAIPPERLPALAARCDALWRRREVVLRSLGPARAAMADVGVSADLQDIAIFAADLRARQADTQADRARGARDALRLLDEAEVMFGPSAVLEHQRQAHRRAAGIAEAPPGFPSPAPRTAWEHYALGRAYLAAGDTARAADALAAAVRLDPAACWPNFYSGLCAYRTGRHADAVAAFSVCIGAAPDVAGCFYNRGLAYAALGQPEAALRDYDRALALEPGSAAAALNRGMLAFAAGRLDGAEADLRRALEHGADPATVHYDLALVRAARGDHTGALGEVARALQHAPTHDPARRLRETLAADTQGVAPAK